MVDQFSNLEAPLLCSGTTMLLAMQHLLVCVIHSELARIRRSQSRLIGFQRLLGQSSPVGFLRATKEAPLMRQQPRLPIKQFLWCCRSAPRELGQDRRG